MSHRLTSGAHRSDPDAVDSHADVASASRAAGESSPVTLLARAGEFVAAYYIKPCDSGYVFCRVALVFAQAVAYYPRTHAFALELGGVYDIPDGSLYPTTAGNYLAAGAGCSDQSFRAQWANDRGSGALFRRLGDGVQHFVRGGGDVDEGFEGNGPGEAGAGRGGVGEGVEGGVLGLGWGVGEWDRGAGEERG